MVFHGAPVNYTPSYLKINMKINYFNINQYSCWNEVYDIKLFIFNNKVVNSHNLSEPEWVWDYLFK